MYNDFLKTQPIMSDQLVRYGQKVWDAAQQKSDLDMDTIVIKSLKDSYDLNVLPNKIDCSDEYIDPDLEFLNALKLVLKYYMTDSQYKDWTDSLIIGNKNG